MKTNKSILTKTAVSTVSPDSSAADPREILVPVDFSQRSVNALRHAAGLAARAKAHLTLLNVVVEPASFRVLDLEAQGHRLQHEHRQQLQKLAESELDPGISAHTVVRTGNPSEEIVRMAVQQHADLIVMGRHEHRGLGQWLHRRTVSHVADNAPCPVMVLN